MTVPKLWARRPNSKAVSDRVKSEIRLWMVGFTAYSGDMRAPPCRKKWQVFGVCAIADIRDGRVLSSEI
jgi:hypothetical protein